jgi:hypothetical protein
MTHRRAFWRRTSTALAALACVAVGGLVMGCPTEGSESPSDANDQGGSMGQDGGRAPDAHGSPTSDADKATTTNASLDGASQDAGSPTPPGLDGGAILGADAGFAEPDAEAGPPSPANGGMCVRDNEACVGDASDPSEQCCYHKCSNGACGGCFAEGVTCDYDGGLVPDGGTPCCDGLSCNQGYCGTGACVPDGTSCGADAGNVCCNDDCVEGVCGGPT